MTLAEAARAMGAKMQSGLAGSITSVSTDTRNLKEGALFFALRGENSDGHHYLAEAFAKGAAAAVVEREVEGISGIQFVVPDTLVALGDFAAHYRAGFQIPVVAITGSVGKTSVKEMTAAALRSRLNVLATEKNFNNEIGVPLTLLKLESQHEAAVIEMGMRGAGEIARLAEIARPDVAVITNIGLSHIERLGSREGIARAKAELLEALSEDGLAIIPADDDYASFLVDTCRARCRSVTFGTAANADFHVTDLVFDEDGCGIFKINGEAIHLHAPGTHQPVNAAAAFAVAINLGLNSGEAAVALAGYRAPAMRLEAIRAPSGMTILDDSYNAAPDSMRAALETLVLLARRRRAVAILGEMRELGEFGPDAHRYVGRIAGGLPLGLLVTVGPSAVEIARAAIEGLDSASIVSFGSTEEAASRVHELLGPDDVVLVKGSRAMEMEKIVAVLRSR